MDTGQNSNDQVLEGIESLKKKVADNKDANINSAPAKRLDHEILMDVAGTLASFVPEMLSFKSSFEAFANEMITLKAQLKAVEDKNSLIKNENITSSCDKRLKNVPRCIHKTWLVLMRVIL